MRPMSAWSADLDLLRTFLVVRERGNLTRAADALFVTQPAVSRRIGRLERSLGVPLFERLGRALCLTEAGEALARDAATLVGASERLAETVRARQSGEQGRLRIGASTTPGLYLLPDALLRFRARFPKLDVQYSVENSFQIEEKILRNDLDLAFVGAHLTHGALWTRPVFTDEIVFFAASTHSLARRTTVNPRDLERETAIIREPGSATRRLVDPWLRRRRVTFGPTLELRCPEAAKSLVRKGLGWSYMSAAGLRGEDGRGVQRLGIPGASLKRPIFLVRHQDKRVSVPMTAFLEEVARSLSGLARGG